MKLQNILFPSTDTCTEEPMYFRRGDKVFYNWSSDGVEIQKDGILFFDTYFNGFTIEKWGPASSTAHQSAMDELFDRIIAYIDDNIYDPLTIPEICEHFSLSRSALQLLFKNSVDQSPKKYINDKKLERSCQMLLENRYTISEISLRLGYSSIHYFSKSFNMKYHMSPSEFVKQNCQSSV